VFQVTDNADLITVTAEKNMHETRRIHDIVHPKPEQGYKLFVVHASVNGAFGDLKPIHMYNRENRARFSGIDVLVRMPGSGGRAGLGLAITNDTGNNKMRIIHDSAKRNTEGVAEFATLMNGSGGFGIDMAS
jgi:hypothetical protein